MDNKSILTLIVGIVAFMVLWPIIKWLALIGIIVVAAFFLKTYLESKKIESQINLDPNQYYEKQKVTSEVIDAEYKEKEIPVEREQ